MSTTPTSTSTTHPKPNENYATEPPPTVASFSPTSTLQSHTSHRSTILVHQKSPLLIATPPQITRALAYSHPFVLPLNKLAGLLSWTTGDPWESFLLVAAFWATVLYGDLILRWAGPLVLAITLILLMFSRRYSPLSSTGWINHKYSNSNPGKDASRSGSASKKPKRKESAGDQHHKSLDEIVSALQLFTSRCNILLDPFLRLTDFLSTQRTATSATTRPALTAFFVRLLCLLPVWWCLIALPPAGWRVLDTRRVVLALGTVLLSWHSRPARVSRTILWRSKTVRRTVATITGLSLAPQRPQPSKTPHKPRNSPPKTAHDIAASLVLRRSLATTTTTPNSTNPTSSQANATLNSPTVPQGIRFTFTLWENQRRWLGIGWTHSMLAYERAAWTDENLNPAPAKDKYALPAVEGGVAKWRWVPGSTWEVDYGISSPSSSSEDPTPSQSDMEHRQTENHKKRRRGNSSAASSTSSKSSKRRNEDDEARGWIFCDNKWLGGRRGVDGWGRYTRRRRWVRDAELIEVDTDAIEDETTPIPSPQLKPSSEKQDPELLSPVDAAVPPGGGKGSNGRASTPSPSKAASVKDAEAESPHRRKKSWFGSRPRSKSRSDNLSNYANHSSPTSHPNASRSGVSLFQSPKDADSKDDNDRGDAASIASSSASRRGSRTRKRDDSEDDGYVPLRFRGRQGTVESDWGVGEDLGMELG